MVSIVTVLDGSSLFGISASISASGGSSQLRRNDMGQVKRSQRKEMLASGAAHKRFSSPQHYLKVQPEAPGF